MDLIKEGFDKQHIEETIKRCDEIIDIIIKSTEILGLGNSGLYTVQQAADYFDVPKSAIEYHINDKRKRKEFEANGLKLYTKQEILNLDSPSLEKIPNRGMLLMTKRTILNIGMLLTESKVAERVRSDILDILFRSDNNGTTAEKIADNVKEEELQKQMAAAILEGDYFKVAIYSAELNALMDKDRKNQNQTCEYDIRDAMQKRCRAVFNLHTPEYNELYKKAKQVTCNRFNVTTWKDLKNYATTHDVIPYIENELDLNVIICELGLEKMKKGKQKRLF